MNLKKNINKIHIDLSNTFSDVLIEEKSNITYGNYVELLITEGNKTIKAIVSKKNLENDTFNWSYYSNPLVENSNLVERTSSVDKFINDVQDIFIKERFDIDYIKNIK